MALDDVVTHECGMATAKTGNQACVGLDPAHIVGVGRLHLEAIFFQVIYPVITAAAGRGFVNVDALGCAGCQRRGAESQGCHQAKSQGVVGGSFCLA